ncbi:helix-turn-helix transcriptional regulator [Actinoplanes sp. CA-252034]|uniref:helix-turn-helix transcriptional regulator n=1 Tax=Actinoplanes sp. CA-252034 TaxID=3239906 RepID=UPI003D9539B8
MEMADVLRQRRAELGMSQVDLATAAGVDKRQIRRYEAGEQQPVLSVAVAIANALKISVGELAGIPSHKVNLSGDWWTSWQSFKDSQEVIAVQPVQLRQQGDLISLQTIARGRPVEDGGYHWRGELRVWDNEVLMGWYAADDGSIRSKGTLYFVLHPHGQRLEGRWVGMSHDGKIVTGFGGMARTEDEARDAITKLRDQKEAA